MNAPNTELTQQPAMDRRFCVAPMLDCTDTHARTFMRMISRHAVLYSEMITTGAIIHGDRERFLNFNESEHPVALQLGGSDPADMATCAKIAQQWGYDEVNINVGCPSDRVQSGAFGACLMQQPTLVAENVAAMREATDIDVTVKCRIGVDDQDPREALWSLVQASSEAGCDTFLVHARKAWLKGLSPKENRDVPPLDYDLVYQLKQDFPHLEIVINGGINSLTDCQQHLSKLDGVMIGREVFANPYILSEVDSLIYGDHHDLLSRDAILDQYLQYVETQLSKGVKFNHLTRHIIGLYHGEPRSRLWRRCISDQAHLPGADGTVLLNARRAMQGH